MLWPFGRQCSTLHCPGLGVLQPGTKTSCGLTDILGHFLAIYNPLFGLRIFKLGLEVGNDEYIILCNTGSRSMSGF